MFNSRPAGWVAFLAVAFCLPSSGAAATPRVQFDVVPIIGCRDVTTPEFAKVNPDEKLVEAGFQVSSLVQHDHAHSLVQYLYLMESPERTFRIVDYSPQTILASDIVQSVDTENRREKSSSLAAGISVKHAPIVGGDVSGSATSTTSSIVRYQQRPPMDLLSAGGTTRRASGVYFKLRPSRQTSLEGAKDFVLVLRGAKAWRGDYVDIRCEATCRGHRSIPALLGSPKCGRARFLVALYVAGDDAAKARAVDFIEAERGLRETVLASRRDIERRSYPTVAHRFGALLWVVDPKIPPTWLDHFVHSPARSSIGTFARHLPPEVREATERFATVKSQLHELSGPNGPLPSTGRPRD